MVLTTVGNRQVTVGKTNTKHCLLPIAYCLLFLTLLAIPYLSTAQKPVPELWGHHVHDDAHILAQETIDAIEQQLKAYEDSTSNQIAILTVQSLDGEVLEEYSLKVAEAWKLGKENKDNGVLLLIAVDDHKMRIEVGQGLEGVLTDAHSNRIIRNEMTPHFRQSDYDAGVTAAVDAMIKSIGGEYAAEDSDEWSTGNVLLLIGGIFFFVFIIGYAFYKEFKNPSAGTTSGGSRSSSRAGTFFSGGRSSSGGSSFSGGGGSFGGGGSSGSW